MPAERSWLDAEWRHHDLSTPILTPLSVYAVEGAASLAHHASGDVDAVAIALATACTFAVWARERHFWLQVYLTTAVAFTLAWIIFAEHFSPFTIRSATGFLIGAALLGVLYPVFAGLERRDQAKHDERLAQRDAASGDWPATFHLLGARGVEFVEETEFRAGTTVELRLPASGKYTLSTISTLRERIETQRDLRRGSVKVREGETARQFFLDVHTRDVLAEDLPFEYESSNATINDPFDIGRDVFGEDIEVLIREIRACVFAPPGSGKSNLLNVLIARLLRCVDVVIWVIDLKSRTVKPWLKPWLEGRTERPVLDWVATTPAEAVLMSKSLVEAINHRSARGEGSKITPSAEQPAILLITDETATLLGLDAAGSRTAMGPVKDVIGRGRSEAVDTILTFLRPVISMTGSSDLKAMSKLRITLPGLTTADAVSATDSPGLSADLAAVEHPGAMIVNKGRAWARLGRSYFMQDSDVPVVAEAYSARRPALEQDLEEALGDAYAQRWSLTRCGHLLPPGRQQELGYDPKSGAGALAKGYEDLKHGNLAHRATYEAAQLIDKANAAQLPTIPPPPANAQPTYRTKQGQPIARKLDDAAVDEMFAELRNDLADLDKAAPTQARAQMLLLIAEAGHAGIRPGELTDRLNAAGHSCVRQTVHGWLNEEIRAGAVVNLGSGIYVTKENSK